MVEEEEGRGLVAPARNAMLGMNIQAAVTAAAAACVGFAIALPAPSDALDTTGNVGRQALGSVRSGFWYAEMDHTTPHIRGYAPDLDGDHVYEIFRAVEPGDGAGIQAAINSATNGTTRRGQWFASQPRVLLTIPTGLYGC